MGSCSVAFSCLDPHSGPHPSCLGYYLLSSLFLDSVPVAQSHLEKVSAILPTHHVPSSPSLRTNYLDPRWCWASLVAQLVKNPPAMWETWVRSVGWEDPLKKGKATHSGIPVWRIPWTSPWGCKESDITEWLSLSFRVMSSRIYWWKERAIVPCLQQDISGSKVEPESVENWRRQGGPTQTPGLLKRQRGQDISGQKEIWVRREKRLVERCSPYLLRRTLSAPGLDQEGHRRETLCRGLVPKASHQLSSLGRPEGLPL